MSNDSTPPFVSLPRSLLEDPLWKNTPPAQKEVFIVVLQHACYKKQKFDDHGQIIDLMPGQFCASIREIQALCGKWITKKIVESTIVKFEKCHFWGQHRGHRKTILTFLHPDICIMFKKQNGTTNGTRRGQDGDINKEREERKEKRERKFSSEIIIVDPMLDNTRSEKGRVLLKQDEWTKLCEKYGELIAKNKAHALSRSLAENPFKYKDHYLTLCNWLSRDDVNKTSQSTAPSKIIDPEPNGAEIDPFINEVLNKREYAN